MTRPAYYQPMSTAPRDGTVVDLWLSGGGRLSDTWWDEEDHSWCGLEENMFTHWAPLPIHPARPPFELPFSRVAQIGLIIITTLATVLYLYFLRSP